MTQLSVTFLQYRNLEIEIPNNQFCLTIAKAKPKVLGKPYNIVPIYIF